MEEEGAAQKRRHASLFQRNRYDSAVRNVASASDVYDRRLLPFRSNHQRNAKEAYRCTNSQTQISRAGILVPVQRLLRLAKPAMYVCWQSAHLVKRLIDETDGAIPAADKGVCVPCVRIEHTAHRSNPFSELL